MKRWLSEWWSVLVICIGFGAFFVWFVSYGVRAGRERQAKQDLCIAACQPYRLIACLNDMGTTKAMCATSDPNVVSAKEIK